MHLENNIERLICRFRCKELVLGLLVVAAATVSKAALGPIGAGSPADRPLGGLLGLLEPALRASVLKLVAIPPGLGQIGPIEVNYEDRNSMNPRSHPAAG